MESRTKDAKLTEYRPHILKCMWPTLKLCAALVKEKIIDASDRERLTQETYSREKAVDEIVDCVYRSPDTAWDAFLRCLEEDEQKDLVSYLRGEVKENLWLTEEIMMHRVTVLQKFKHSKDFYGYLRTEGVLDQSDRDWLKDQGDKQKKIDYILRILETKRPSAWPNFIFCLLCDNQRGLAEQIDNELVKKIAATNKLVPKANKTRPPVQTHSVENLKLHTDQLHLKIMPNNIEGIESLCHAIADQLNNNPDKSQNYCREDISKVLSTSGTEDHMQYIANRFRVNIAVLKDNGTISYKHPVKDSKEYTLLLGQLGHGAYVSLTEKKEAPEVESMKTTLREEYIRQFCDATPSEFESCKQSMKEDLRKTHVGVEFCNKSKQGKMGRKENPQDGNGRIEEDDMFLPYMDQRAPRSVLLEGEGGVGKTTFIQRWMYEWATRTGSKYLHKVRLPILLRATQIKEGIPKGIKDFFPKEYSDKMYSYVEAHQEHCLLVIDAFDETDISSQDYLREFLKGRSLPRLRVLVTSRNEQAKAYEKYFDRLVVLQGLEENKVQEFIEKYITCFKDLTPDCMEHQINLMFEKIPMKMLRNPLACSLLINLPIDDITPADMTLNSVYREYIKCIMKRCELDKARANELLGDLQSFALWNLIKGDDFDEKLLSQFGVDLDSKCEGTNRLLNFFIQTQYFMKGNDEEKKLTFVHKQMQEYLAAQVLVALKESEQKLAVIGVLVLKCRFDCLRFIMASTKDVDHIQEIAALVFINSYGPVCLKVHEDSISTSCQALCSKQSCSILKKIAKLLGECIVIFREIICDLQPLLDFQIVLDLAPFPYKYIKEWMKHTCDYEWSDMITKDLEFVGKVCFLLIEWICIDQPRYGVFIEGCPNIHRRSLPLVKRVPTLGDNLVSKAISLQVIKSKDSSSHIEIQLHQQEQRIINACGEDLPIALEQAIPTITGGNTKPQNTLSLTQQFTLTIWLNWRKPMTYDERDKFDEGLQIYMRAGLRNLHIGVQRMRYSLKLLPSNAPNLSITIQYQDSPSRKDWVAFMTEVCEKKIQSLFITGENSMDDRGASINLIDSFRHKMTSINRLIIGKGTLPSSELKQALFWKKDDIIRFKHLHITNVRNILDVQSVLSGPLANVSLEAGPDFKENITPEGCKQCLSLTWHNIVASDATCDLYTGILEKSQASNMVVELPPCQKVEHLENFNKKIFPSLKDTCRQWQSGCTSRVNVSETLVDSLTTHAKQQGIYYLSDVGVFTGSSCVYLHSPWSDEEPRTDSDVFVLPNKATGEFTLITREISDAQGGKVTCIYGSSVSNAVTAMEKIKGESCQSIRVYLTSRKHDHLDACGTFRKIIQEMMTNGLRNLSFFVKSVTSCVGLVPNDGQNLTVHIQCEENSSSEEWNMLLKDIQSKKLCSLSLSQNVTQERNILMEILDGDISEMRSIQGLAITSSRIPINLVQKVMEKDSGNIMKYEGTCITGIRSSGDLKSVLSRSIIDVSLEASHDFEVSLTPEECQKCLTLPWLGCVASAETCQLYGVLLKKSTQCSDIINLPCCTKAEHVMNLKDSIFSIMHFRHLQWHSGCTSRVVVSESLVDSLTKHAKQHGIYYLSVVPVSSDSICIFLHSPGSDEEHHTDSDVVVLPIEATGELTLITKETTDPQDGKATHIYCRNVSHAVLAMKKIRYNSCEVINVLLTSTRLTDQEACRSFRDIAMQMTKSGLKKLAFTVKSVISCVSLVPDDGHNLTVPIQYKEESSSEEWNMFLKDMQSKKLCSLIILAQNAQQERSVFMEVLDGYISEMRSIQEVRIIRGRIPINLVQKVMEKDSGNIMKYQDTCITGIRCSGDLKSVLSGPMTDVSLEASPDFEVSLTHEECQKCLTLPWQHCIASAENCHLYGVLLKKSTQCSDIINLPCCKEAEHVMNLKESILSFMPFKHLQWQNGCTSKVAVSEALVDDVTKHAEQHEIYYLSDVSVYSASISIYLHCPGPNEEYQTDSDVVVLPNKATGELTLITRETSALGRATHIHCSIVSCPVLAMKKMKEECKELQVYLSSISPNGDEEESAIFRGMVSLMISQGLRYLHIFVKRIICCVGLIPEASGELLVITVVYKDNPGTGDLEMFMKDICKKHIPFLVLAGDLSCPDRSNLVKVLGMYISEMANIEKLVIAKGMVSMNLIEQLMKKDTRNIISYARLLITEVRNISQIKLLFSRKIMDVTLKAGPGFEESLTSEECEDCLRLDWQSCVADAEKCELYIMIKKKAGQVVTHMTQHN